MDGAGEISTLIQCLLETVADDELPDLPPLNLPVPPACLGSLYWHHFVNMGASNLPLLLVPICAYRPSAGVNF